MAEQRWSQASQRKNEIMLDQHGRQYATVIEIRTGHPITISPLFRAPLMPPDKFIRMRRPGEQAPGWANPYCKLVVDYDAWAAELEQTHAAYERKKQQLATRIGGSRAVEEYRNPSPMLLQELGPPPQPVEPVLAAKEGHPWLLGLRRPDGSAYPKPPEAEKYFPERQQETGIRWSGTDDEPAAEPQGATKAEAKGAKKEEKPPVVYPRAIPGGRFQLSDGRVLKCSREEAEELEQAIQDAKEAERLVAAGAEAGIGPGWEA